MASCHPSACTHRRLAGHLKARHYFLTRCMPDPTFQMIPLAACQSAHSTLQQLANYAYDATTVSAFCSLLRLPSWRHSASCTGTSPMIEEARHFNPFRYTLQRLQLPLHALYHCRPCRWHAHLCIKRHPDTLSHGHDHAAPFSCSKKHCACRRVSLCDDHYHQHRPQHGAKLYRCYQVPFLFKAHMLRLRTFHYHVIHALPFGAVHGDTDSSTPFQNDVWARLFP